MAKIANDDTPANVTVPNTLSGLAQYVIAKWGPWGVILIGQFLCGYLYVTQVAQTIKIQQDQISQQQAQISALHTMIQTMDRALKMTEKREN